jgi:DNA-binding MarR family transcriptional regulator
MRRNEPMIGQSDVSRSIRKALQVIELFREYNPQMQAQMMTTFLHIALNPNITQEELRAKTGYGLASSSMTRNIDELSDETIKGKKGFGLVHRSDGVDRRTKEITITRDKGQRLLAEIIHIIEHGD